MKQLSRIMSTYSPDTSGVCSALYELGGMVVIHDASGCNSTYTTFDEPRWYDMDSMIYGSGLDETDAMLGNDDRLIDDVVSAASDLHPNFIAVTGGPVPMMVGTDFDGIAGVIEKRTGIPTFGFFTNGVNFYCSGAGMALEAIAKRFCTGEISPAAHKNGAKTAVNLIGATPLDFSIKGNIPVLREMFETRGYEIVSVWAMGSRFEDIVGAGGADVNVVVSACGLPAARFLNERYGTPFVTGLPIGNSAADELFTLIDKAAAEKKNQNLLSVPDNSSKVCNSKNVHFLPYRDAKTLIIGEQIYANSMRCCLRADYGLQNIRTLCPIIADPDSSLLLAGDSTEDTESGIEKIIAEFDIIVADPLYRNLLPRVSDKVFEDKIFANKIFVDMPHEAFSGRMYREESPCIMGEAIHSHLAKYLKNNLKDKILRSSKV